MICQITCRSGQDYNHDRQKPTRQKTAAKRDLGNVTRRATFATNERRHRILPSGPITGVNWRFFLPKHRELKHGNTSSVSFPPATSISPPFGRTNDCFRSILRKAKS